MAHIFDGTDDATLTVAINALETFACRLSGTSRAIVTLAWELTRQGKKARQLDATLDVSNIEDVVLAEIGALSISAAIEAHNFDPAKKGSEKLWSWFIWRLDACVKAASKVGVTEMRCKELH